MSFVTKHPALILCHGRKHQRHIFDDLVDWEKSCMFDISAENAPDRVIDVGKRRWRYETPLIIAMFCPFYVMADPDTGFPNPIYWQSISRSLTKDGMFLGVVPKNALKRFAASLGFTYSSSTSMLLQRTFLECVIGMVDDKLRFASNGTARYFAKYPQFFCLESNK